MDDFGDGQKGQPMGGRDEEISKANTAVMEPGRSERKRDVPVAPAEQVKTTSNPETDAGVDVKNSIEDKSVTPEGEVMTNLPRRRPHRRTARRHRETVRRQKAATRSRRRAASASALKKPAGPRRKPGAGPTGSELGFMGQVAGQAVRITVDAASFGLRLTGGILKRLAGQGE